MMRRRLFWKILFAFWLTFLAITQGVWLLFEAKHDAGPPPRREMAMAGEALLSAGAAVVQGRGAPGFASLVAGLPEAQRGRFSLVSAAAPAPAGGAVLARDVAGPDGRRWQIRYRQETMPPPPRFWRLNSPPELLVLGLLGGLVFSAALAWYLTEPIKRLRDGFEALAQGDLDTRLGARMGRRRDEIADLARDFDRMAQRLEQSVAARDRLLHDVSHELRSPLTRMRLAVELARGAPERIEASLDRLDRETGRLDALVGELLALARVEHQGRRGEDYLDLVEVVQSVVDDARYEAQGRAIPIELAVVPPDAAAMLHGDGELIRRAIDNVLRNALRFSPRGEPVRVVVSVEGGRGRIAIADHGPGVGADELSAIFDPFVRGENPGDRGGVGSTGVGMGLGLAIASRAVAAHDGAIAARNRPEGGLEIAMTLPLVA